MITFEKAQEICRKNAQSRIKPTPPIEWSRETGTSMVSKDNRFRITRQVESGTTRYYAEFCATQQSPPKPIGGSFLTFEQAKDAVALHQ